MNGSGHRAPQPHSPGRGYAVLVALMVSCMLAATPLILRALHLRINAGPPKVSHGVRLLHAPSAPPGVALSPVASPIDPGQPPAPLPTVNPAHEAAVVAAEDGRIRTLLHNAVRIYQPEVIPVRGSLPTLVLPAGPRAYTEADLVQYGALLMLPHRAGLLIDNVFVASHAKLTLGVPRLQTLYLDSSTSGFASIVAWGGSLSFNGSLDRPLTIMGWDRVAKAPATEQGSGRSYIRDVGGRLDFTDARVSSLGFWSGRTGGVAWTGVNGQPSTGSATSSTFTNDTYGAFVVRGNKVSFYDDLFEFNQLDGLHIHRGTINATANASAAVRNGGNGFLVDRATQSVVLRDDVAQHNGGNGFLVDGRPLVNGASASGNAVAPGSGTNVEDSAALGNLRTGILVEGGTGTVLKANEVCAPVTGIAIRFGAVNTVVTGNDIRCNARAGLSIGPAAPGTMVSGNTVAGTRIGVLIRSAGRIEVDSNLITSATVFGITARGETSQVSGQANVISGTGFRAVDARADADMPALSGTNTAAWAHRVKVNFWSYLRFHPLAALWLSILLVVVLGALWAHRRKLPRHPYEASTRWWSEVQEGIAPVAAQSAHPAPEPSTAHVPALLSGRLDYAAMAGDHDDHRNGGGNRRDYADSVRGNGSPDYWDAGLSRAEQSNTARQQREPSPARDLPDYAAPDRGGRVYPAPDLPVFAAAERSRWDPATDQEQPDYAATAERDLPGHAAVGDRDLLGYAATAGISRPDYASPDRARPDRPGTDLGHRESGSPDLGRRTNPSADSGRYGYAANGGGRHEHGGADRPLPGYAGTDRGHRVRTSADHGRPDLLAADHPRRDHASVDGSHPEIGGPASDRRVHPVPEGREGSSHPEPSYLPSGPAHVEPVDATRPLPVVDRP